MKKLSQRKLSLCTETLRELEHASLKRVAGGMCTQVLATSCHKPLPPFPDQNDRCY